MVVGLATIIRWIMTKAVARDLRVKWPSCEIILISAIKQIKFEFPVEDPLELIKWNKENELDFSL